MKIEQMMEQMMEWLLSEIKDGHKGWVAEMKTGHE
jgi:hypothetical protein